MKRWGSGAYYSNTGFMAQYNPLRQAFVGRGTLADHQYRHVYSAELRSAATETLLGWDFESTTYEDIPQDT